MKPHRAGHLVNELQDLAENIYPSPRIVRSPDTSDDSLLAFCEAGEADRLATGDKSGLLFLARHKRTRIMPPSDFAAFLAR